MSQHRFSVGLVCLLLSCSVERVILPVADSPVEVESLSVQFSDAPSMTVKTKLTARNSESKAATVTQVLWEVFLDGRFFASGIEQVNVEAPAVSWVEIPLELPAEFRHWAVRPEPRDIRVEFRGQLVMRWENREYAFRFVHEKKQNVTNAPVWDAVNP